MNNHFLALYKKYTSHQQKIKKTNDNYTTPFDDLYNEYKQRNHPYPKNALKGNIFKNDPLLMIHLKDLEDYYQKDSRKDIINEYEKDKSIKKLNHIEILAIKKAKKLADPSKSTMNYFDIINKRIPDDKTKDVLYDKRDLEKLKDEIERNQRDIDIYNDLMSESVDNNVDSIDANNYIIMPKQSLKEETNNIINHFSQREIFPYKSKQNANSNSNSHINNSKISKSKKNITLSSFCLTSSKRKITNSDTDKVFIISKKHKVQFSPLYSNKGNTTTINKDKSNSTFSSTFHLKNNNKNLSRISSSNSCIKYDTPEQFKKREMELLYDKISKTNIFNKHFNTDDTIIKLSSYFNKKLTPKNNLNDIISSFSLMQNKVKQFNIPESMKKLYINNIPLKTLENLEKMQKVDTSLSGSEQMIMKTIMKLHV